MNDIYLRFEDWYIDRWQKKGSPFWPLWWIVAPLIRLFNNPPHLLFCPHCWCDDFDFFEEPFFVCTDYAESSTPDGNHWWFRGIQTCPRCRHEFPVSESD